MSQPFKQKLVIDHAKVASQDLTNFPVLVRLTGMKLDSKAVISFTSDEGAALLAHQIVRHDRVAGALDVWVRIPRLSASADTVIVVQAGEPQTSAPPYVWDGHTKLVADQPPAQIPHRSELTITEAITVEAWIDVSEARAEAWQPILSKWQPAEGMERFEAYDAGRTDGLDTTGFFGAVFDGRYVYFVPQHDLHDRHGKALRYDTHGDFKSPDSWEGYDAGRTDGLNTKGYYGAVFDGRYVYYVPRRDEEGFHSRVLRFDTHTGFKDPTGWQAYDAGLDRSYQSAAFDGRYIYFTPGHAVVHKDEVLDRPDCDSPSVTGMDPDYYLIGHGTVLRYDTRGEFKATSSWTTYDAADIDGQNACDYDGAVFDGRYVYFAPLSTSVALRYDTQSDFHDNTSWSAHHVGSLGMKMCVGAVFDGRHVYYVPYGQTTSAIRYDTRKPFGEGSSWSVFDVTTVPDLPISGYDGALYDGRYIYYVPYYNFGDGFHGVMLRYDTRREFVDPSSWDWADGGLTDGLKTVSFNGGASDGRYLYFAAWMDGQCFPEKIIGNGRVLRYDTVGAEASFSLRWVDCGHNGGLCAAVPGARFIVNTEGGVLSIAANEVPAAGKHHVVGVYDGNTIRLYIDGELVNEQSGQGRICTSTVDLAIGPILGVVKHVRICDVARSAAWIKTQHQNLRDPVTFCHPETSHSLC